MPVLSPAAPLDPMPGLRFTPLAAPSRGSRRTSVWRVEIRPGTPATPHQLTEEEILVVLSGTASLRMAGEDARAGAGDAVVVPADTDFALWNDGPEPLHMLCVLPVGGRARTGDGEAFTPPWAR